MPNGSRGTRKADVARHSYDLNDLPGVEAFPRSRRSARWVLAAPKTRWAAVSLITATGALAARSSAVRERPATIGVAHRLEELRRD